MPVLSVIMPVYNSARYLEESVGSVLSSSFQNLELILVDDGSTDGSSPLCDRLAAEDPRITVIHQPNGGVSRARNRGLDIAQGTYVAFVDSDDQVVPEMYEKLLRAAIPNYDIAFCDIYLHYRDNNIPIEPFALGAERSQTIGNLLLSRAGRGLWHALFRRNLIGTLRFPEYLHSGEDLWFTLRLFCSASSIIKINEPLYIYNQENNGSITHTLDISSEKSILQRMQENRDYLKEIGLFETVKQEYFWAVLRFKTGYALDPDRIERYRTVFPEANRYLFSCPILGFRIKVMMMMIDLYLDPLVRIILRRYHAGKQ